MPKKLNIHPNERIDIPDYVRGSNGFTEDSIHYVRKTLVSSSGSVYLLGFRVEIANQSTSPGEFTVHNGKALDRLGRQLHNEDEVTKTATSTLPGASTTYYIEIEYVETDTDVDSRAFWDPTFVNSGDQLPGKEFLLNVSTRVSSDWTLVSPVSTSGFEKDSNPSSNKIPLAVLDTNSSGEITGVTTVPASDLLEVEAASGANEVTVLDSSIFPSSGDAVIGFGGGNPETVTITANDYENNVISFTPSLVNTQPAGSIIRQTGSGISSFLEERKSGVSDTSDTDQQRRMWQGDENRGSVVLTSKETFGDRSDLNIRDLKDHVDALASQLRELKFGTGTVGSLSGELPPLSSSEWSEGRWYSRAGGLWGARSYAVTIGDGTNSLGDLNTASGVTDLASVLQEAIDAATSGGISIFVKQGDYTFETTPVLNKPLNIVFEEGATVGADVANIFSIESDDSVEITNFKFDPSSGSSSDGIVVVDGAVNTADIQFYRSEFSTITTTSGTFRLVLENCSLTSRTTYCLDLPGNIVALNDGSRVSNCLFTSDGGPGVGAGKLHNLLFEDNACNMNGSAEVFNCDDSSPSFTGVPDIVVKDCTFDNVSASASAPFRFQTVNVGFGPVFDRCVFTNISLSAGTTGDDRSIFYFAAGRSYTFTDNLVEDVIVTGASEGSPGYIINCPFSVDKGTISGCIFGSSSHVGSFNIHVRARDGVHDISNNNFNYPYIGIQTGSQNNTNGESRIVGNRIVYDASGTAATGVIGIESGHLVRSYIAENYIRLVQDTVNSPFEFIGINISQAPWGGVAADGTTLLTITNNTIDGIGGTTSGSTGLAYGIKFNDNTAALYVDVVGNKIHGVTQDGELHGINFVSDSLRGFFSNNSISIKAAGNAVRLRGISFDVVSITENIKIIENNEIFVHNTLDATTKLFALYFSTTNISVIGNSLTVKSDVTPSNTDVAVIRPGTGAENVTIYSNTLRSETSVRPVILLVDGVYENITISNNMFLCSGRGVEFSGTGSVVGLTVNGNTFEYSGTYNPLRFLLSSSDFNIQLTNNIFYEQSWDANAVVIYVQGGSTSKPELIRISENTIRGQANASGGANRNVSAIRVANCLHPMIQNNSVYHWAGDRTSGGAGGDGTCIHVSDCSYLSLVGNFVQAGDDAANVDHIVSTGTSEALIDSNYIAPFGNLVTTGGTGEVLGDNKTALG